MKGLEAVIKSAASAADLIMASISLHVAPIGNSFLDSAVWKSILPREWRIAIPASLMWVDNSMAEA